VKESLARFLVTGHIVPRLLDHIFEPGHLDPKVFKPERPWLFWPFIASKEKGAMVGQRRGEGMKDMRGEGNVPFLIAKEGIKLAHRRDLLLIAPSKLSVLEVDLFEVTNAKSVAKSYNPTTVCIASVLVTGTVDLVEITGDKPSSARGRLGSN
jgi:hypothetical protein